MTSILFDVSILNWTSFLPIRFSFCWSFGMIISLCQARRGVSSTRLTAASRSLKTGNGDHHMHTCTHVYHTSPSICMLTWFLCSSPPDEQEPQTCRPLHRCSTLMVTPFNAIDALKSTGGGFVWPDAPFHPVFHCFPGTGSPSKQDLSAIRRWPRQRNEQNRTESCFRAKGFCLNTLFRKVTCQRKIKKLQIKKLKHD